MEEVVIAERLRDAEQVLKRVVVPGFDVDVITSGVVTRLRISKDGRRLVVYLDFKRSDPKCPFCMFISHALWTTIAREIRDSLLGRGLFEEVSVVDEVTNAQVI
ncbi:MAG: hypothetical protein QXM76_01635 [Zestosphaera sp.]